MVNGDKQTPIFILHESVYDKVGEHITSNEQQHKFSIHFLFSLVWVNVDRHEAHKHSISFTTQQILDSVKDNDYTRKLKDPMLGEPGVDSVQDPVRGGYKIENLIKAANEKMTELLGKFIIVVSEDGPLEELEDKIDEGDYEIEVLTAEEAIAKGKQHGLDLEF